MSTDLPDPADALFGAEWQYRRATELCRHAELYRHTELYRHDDPAGLASVLAALLEAAGGTDVGNAARRHLERNATRPARPAVPTVPAAVPDSQLSVPLEQRRVRVLDAAHRLFLAAELDLRTALAGAGLPVGAGPPVGAGLPVGSGPPVGSELPVGFGTGSPSSTEGDPTSGRPARAAFAERALDQRRATVEAVLSTLGAGHWSPAVSVGVPRPVSGSPAGGQHRVDDVRPGLDQRAP